MSLRAYVQSYYHLSVLCIPINDNNKVQMNGHDIE